MLTRATDRRYDRAAPDWTAALARLGYDRAYAGLLDRVPAQDAAGRPGPMAVCDMGCGSGLLAGALVRRTGFPARLVLVDPSAEMLRQAQIALPGAQAVQARVETYRAPVPFDLVMAAHVIEHCADPAAAMARLAGLVAPGGRLVLVVSRPHWCQWAIWLRWRHRWFAAVHVLQMARAAGLHDVLVHDFAHGPPSRTSLGYVFRKPLHGNGVSP